MREIRDEPILTDTYVTASEFRPEANSLYVFGISTEERSKHMASWRDSVEDIVFKEIEKETPNSFSVAGYDQEYFLRSSSALATFFSDCVPSTKIYIDITGLTHSVWAGLLRAALFARFEVRVVYVEPNEYGRSPAPLEGQIYDLSTKITGIAPLPGFAVLSAKTNADFIFVPLLGFEGTRLRHLIEQVQPASNRIFPVVGSPGFKPGYVFETYSGNRSALMENAVWQSVRYAPANCPFSCFYLLTEFAQSAPRSSLKIAPIGTKPHALGAVLFALTSSTPTELVYDHPIRKSGRTGGADRLFVYHVTAIASGLASTANVRRDARRITT
jgi:hypothetical protein